MMCFHFLFLAILRREVFLCHYSLELQALLGASLFNSSDHPCRERVGVINNQMGI